MQNLKLYWFLHKEFFKGLLTGLIATQASSILLWGFLFVLFTPLKLLAF